jgi:hypothetical protein
MRALAIAVSLLCATPALGQELEPRSYSPAPIGTTFLIAGIGGSEGALFFDPSVPVHDVRAELTIATFAFGYTFGLAGHQARILAVAPVASGHISGEVGGHAERFPMDGLVDPRIKLSFGLTGAPALGVAEFASASRGTVIGASVTVMPPLGAYDEHRVVNLGYNRWGFKPEIGMSRPLGRWTLEGYLGAWLFTTNGSYFPGNARKSQAPILSLQGHVGYALTRRSWLAFNATWFEGGETQIDRIVSPDQQRNLRLGATLSIPAGKSNSVKVVYNTGATTRRGSDFDTLSLQWQRVWF